MKKNFGTKKPLDNIFHVSLPWHEITEWNIMKLLEQYEKSFLWDILYQTLFSFVTMSTLTVWSNELQTQSPLLSGLQSRLEIGCVDSVTFCKRLTEPATPISMFSESFLERCAGYSLEIKTSIAHLRNVWCTHFLHAIRYFVHLYLLFFQQTSIFKTDQYIMTSFRTNNKQWFTIMRMSKHRPPFHGFFLYHIFPHTRGGD